MFEILSTIGLTASASLVIAFLAHAMAERPRDARSHSGGKRRTRLWRRQRPPEERKAEKIWPIGVSTLRRRKRHVGGSVDNRIDR